MNEQAASGSRPATATAVNGTVELLEEGLAEAKELVRLEVLLARDEMSTEARALSKSAIGFAAAAALGLLGLSALLAALIVATSWVVGLLSGITLLIAAAGFGLWGRRKLPKRPMKETKERVVRDVNSVREELS